MEKRINTMIENHTSKFKDSIRNKINEIEFSTDNKKLNELLEYIYNYDRLTVTKDDFIKRKRVKNLIPVVNRCIAKRANNEQCTRRKKTDCEYCGTHYKGTPHGSVNSNMNVDNNTVNKKIEVFAEDIRGIFYYIDKFNNVYKTEDILAGKENPEIIAKCVKHENNYSIPDLGVY